MYKRIHVFRIKPGQEILSEIEGYCRKNQVTSGIIIGLIGSVMSARLNFLKILPGQFETEEYDGPLEITCGQGSVALKDNDLILHIHLQLSSQQVSRGGHLAHGIVFSTAEVVIGELDYHLKRYTDEQTGLNELIG